MPSRSKAAVIVRAPVGSKLYRLPGDEPVDATVTAAGSHRSIEWRCPQGTYRLHMAAAPRPRYFRINSLGQRQPLTEAKAVAIATALEPLDRLA